MVWLALQLLEPLQKDGFENLILFTRDQLDLTVQSDVKSFFNNNSPEYVFVCAAKVGGIYANDHYGGDFLYQNLQIQNNIIHFSHLFNVKTTFS